MWQRGKVHNDTSISERHEGFVALGIRIYICNKILFFLNLCFDSENVIAIHIITKSLYCEFKLVKSKLNCVQKRAENKFFFGGVGCPQKYDLK